jgi:SAM-dependent methyltransferase
MALRHIGPESAVVQPHDGYNPRMIRQAPAFVLALAAALPIGAQQAQPVPQASPAVRTPESERERWNKVFTIQPANIRTDANRFLVQVAKELKPEEALDIGMGFGRNAIHLARQGWKVTGIDISDVGVQKAQQQAQAEKLPLTAVRADMFTYDYGRDRYDLIVFVYMGGGMRMADPITDALKPGGVLVIEHFLKQPDSQIGYESNLLPKLYPRLEVLRYADADSNPDYDQETKSKVVQFLARKPVK